ncbi:MAG: NUDIX hydrolase [Actinomycetaceae bacterium]|nr:NUDIX hydrolase [Actinomycetaceae bacterium]
MIQDQRSQYPVTSHKRLWTGPVFDLDEDYVVVVEGEPAVARQFLAHTGAVAVVAYREREGVPEVAFVDQYRHPVQATLWEVPAGLLDVEGEDPLEAAKRELWEEADLRADTWHTLVDYFTTPGASTEGLRIFLARDVHDVPENERFKRSDEERAMQRVWVPLEEAVAAVHAGRLHNPSAVVGVLATASARANGWRSLRDPQADWFRSPFNREDRTQF